jgi:prevent-host-death family protein
MNTIGVRELRQYASRYLARVAHGETFEVTDRGRPVARLVPLERGSWSDLIASGMLLPPEDDKDIADEPPGDYGVPASATLARQRAEER